MAWVPAELAVAFATLAADPIHAGGIERHDGRVASALIEVLEDRAINRCFRHMLYMGRRTSGCEKGNEQNDR